MTPYEPTSGNGQHDSHNVAQRVGALGDSAQQLLSEARGAVGDLNQLLDLDGRIQRNPYGVLAVAAGIGYLLGGGLFTPLTGRIVHLGIRLAALPFVKGELLSMAESALDGLGQSTHRSAPRSPSNS